MSAADIVDVVKEFVTLRKAGVNYKGLCPFHNEKTPSFVVSPSKQLCKCFSCGKGGNVVHFVMEHEQMNYPEALRWLAKKYGIEIQEKELTNEERAAQSVRESMFVLNEWANKYFEETLHNHVDGVAIGMAYFRQRGLRDDIIRKFHLGYSLPVRDALAKAALAKGFSEEMLEKTGLCYRTDEGRLLDRYHARVIFPVQTVSGMTVAFGGRTLSADKKVAKYVNSPESEIYSKSRELYGLYLAKHAIVKQNRCYLVEGYMDVIAMHQSGIENVVASSGTSLTEGQIRLIHRFTDNITVLYDGDSAGIHASLRGIDMLLAEGLNVKVLLLPDGDDPDSFARKHSAADFQNYVETRQVDFIRFKTRLLLNDAADDPVKRASLVQDVVNSIAVIPDGIVRQMYVSECARLLSAPEQLVVSEIAKIRRGAAASPRPGADRPTPRADAPAAATATGEENAPAAEAIIPGTSPIVKEEEMLIAAVLRYGERPLTADASPLPSEAPASVARYVSNSLAADAITFRSPLFRQVLQEAAALTLPPGETALSHFLAHPDPEVSSLAARLGTDKYVLCQSQRQGFVKDEDRLGELVPRLVHDFKNTFIKRQMKTILLELSKPENQTDAAKCRSLMERYKEMCEIEKQFAQVLGDRVLNT